MISKKVCIRKKKETKLEIYPRIVPCKRWIQIICPRYHKKAGDQGNGGSLSWKKSQVISDLWACIVNVPFSPDRFWFWFFFSEGVGFWRLNQLGQKDKAGGMMRGYMTYQPICFHVRNRRWNDVVSFLFLVVSNIWEVALVVGREPTNEVSRQ